MSLLIRAVFASLAATSVIALPAEPRFPANIASVTPRFVQHALFVIPVKVNQAGPFDFIVDVGSQVTVIEPPLASELHLKARDRVGRMAEGQVSFLTGNSYESDVPRRME
jgi:hypothetical protein